MSAAKESAAQRVLLTGGAGFIGSHLAEALLRRGHPLAIVDNLDDFYPRDWKEANLEDVRRAGKYEFFRADVCDAGPLREAAAGFRPDVVIHLAARAGVRPSIEQPQLYERVNVAGTLNVLEVCRELQVPRLVFGSSSSVYGASSRVPFSEDEMQLQPISPYAATKLAGEMLCYTYAHLFGLRVIAVRIFTVYGPRQRPDLAIHKFTARIEAGKPIPIFGDGATARDYTYVDDIVAGVLATLDYDIPVRIGAGAFEVFNLGNSQPCRLSDLVDLLESVTGRKAIREHVPAQPGDVPITWAEVSKAANRLGFRPNTPLVEGLRRFVAWYRSADPCRRA